MDWVSRIQIRDEVVYISQLLGKSMTATILLADIGFLVNCSWCWGSGLEVLRSTPSLLLLASPLCPGVVIPVRVLSVSQIELLNRLEMIIIISYLKPYNYVQIICIW